MVRSKHCTLCPCLMRNLTSARFEENLKIFTKVVRIFFPLPKTALCEDLSHNRDLQYSLVTVPLLSIFSGWILDQLSNKVNRLCVLVNFKTFGNRSGGTGIAQKNVPRLGNAPSCC